MTPTAWNRARSEFNHSWLKNRVVIALGRAQNVLSGAVEDESIWSDLAGLLIQWKERQRDAVRILSEFRAVSSLVRDSLQQSFLNLDPEVRDWLRVLASERSKGHVEMRVVRGLAALEEFDRELRRFTSELAKLRGGRSPAANEIPLSSFKAATMELAEAFAELGLNEG